MSRLIIADRNKPYQIKPSDRSTWVCQCGLSKNKPFCDGSHTRTIGETEGSTYYYGNLTQKQVDVSGVKEQIYQGARHLESVIYRNGDIEIVRFGFQSNLMSEVYTVRSNGGSKISTDLFDSWSDLYLMRYKDQYVATMRVTQARDGMLDCETTYPAFLQNANLRKYIGSASRLYKLPDAPISTIQILNFIVTIWKDQYADGMRIDLINSTLKMVKYYERLGYKKVGDIFIHPRTLKESQAMVFITHSMWKAKLSNYLEADYSQHEATFSFDYSLARQLIFPASEVAD